MVVGRRAILWMVAIASMTEAMFNAIEAGMRREAGFVVLWIGASLVLFGLAFVVEKYKLLREG